MKRAALLAALLLSWAAFASVAALVVLTPFTALLARRVRRLDERIMDIRDRRTTLKSQIVHGIRVVKYRAWEESVHADGAAAAQARAPHPDRTSVERRVRFRDLGKHRDDRASIGVPSFASLKHDGSG